MILVSCARSGRNASPKHVAGEVPKHESAPANTVATIESMKRTCAERVDSLLAIHTTARVMVANPQPGSGPTLPLAEGHRLINPGFLVVVSDTDSSLPLSELDKFVSQHSSAWLQAPIVYIWAPATTHLSQFATALAHVPPTISLRLLTKTAEQPIEAPEAVLSSPRVQRWREANRVNDQQLPPPRAISNGVIQAVGAGCPDALSAWSTPEDWRGDLGAIMVKRVATAMQKCECAVDNPDLYEYLAHTSFTVNDPVRWLPLPSTVALRNLANQHATLGSWLSSQVGKELIPVNEAASPAP